VVIPISRINVPFCWIPLLLLTGCLGPGSALRETRLVRRIFYPPVFGVGRELVPADNTSGDAYDHSIYAEILSRHVDERGFVDYRALSREADRLDVYLSGLAEAERDGLSRFAELALLLNAYNAFTLGLILDHPGVASIRDIPEPDRWKDERWVIDGTAFSLWELEHRVIRRRFMEPRVHFALVCAAKGCPKLRREPYRGEQLLRQLSDQARSFFADPAKLRWVPDQRVLYVSELIDWYRADFAKDKDGVIDYVVKYLDPVRAEEIGRVREQVRLEYLEYNWDLNGTW